MSELMGCCGKPEWVCKETCHDCGATEVPKHKEYSADRGETICINCGRMAIEILRQRGEWTDTPDLP